MNTKSFYGRNSTLVTTSEVNDIVAAADHVLPVVVLPAELRQSKSRHGYDEDVNDNRDGIFEPTSQLESWKWRKKQARVTMGLHEESVDGLIPAGCKLHTLILIYNQHLCHGIVPKTIFFLNFAKPYHSHSICIYLCFFQMVSIVYYILYNYLQMNNQLITLLMKKNIF